MKEKKTTKRLLPMMDLEDLYELFGEDNRGTNLTLMRRRRGGGLSEKTNPWKEFDEEKEGINTLLYTYDLQAGPQLRLVGKIVRTFSEDGEELEDRPLEYARTICMLARKYKGKRATEPLYLLGEEGKEFAGKKDSEVVSDTEPNYELWLLSDGSVKVGCQRFDWEEIDAFAKKMHWWK